MHLDYLIKELDKTSELFESGETDKIIKGLTTALKLKHQVQTLTKSLSRFKLALDEVMEISKQAMPSLLDAVVNKKG